jgi:hypothetical protein
MEKQQIEVLEITAQVLKSAIYAIAAENGADLLTLGRLLQTGIPGPALHPAAIKMLDHIGDTLISASALPDED